MTILRPRTAVLFVGDVFFLSISLWLSLFLRAFDVPSWAIVLEHLLPFSILFFVWVLVFFIAGLYESRSIIFARRALSSTLLIAQSINVLLAALFFFLLPYFGIEPKTLLFIYLGVSFFLVLIWRAYLFPTLGLQKPESALLIGAGGEVDELAQALALAHRAPARIVRRIDPNEPALATTIAAAMRECNPRFVIADFADARVSNALPDLYNYLLQRVRFFDSADLFEDVFGRVPLSRIDGSWVARNASREAYVIYDPLKHAIDVVCAFVIGMIALIFFPFIMLAIYLEDRGSPFVSLPRVGEGGRVFSMYKFRSMNGNDQGNYGALGKTQLRITRVGKFLRRWRLDELPQLANVIAGDLSFIGPRPETPTLVASYEQAIPFYGVRHLVRPGLSGSAQLYYHGDPHGAQDVSATAMKLSYDIFYLKHRSLSLDLSIFLKTIRRLVSRSNN